MELLTATHMEHVSKALPGFIDCCAKKSRDELKTKTLGLCMIVKNEETFLASCLESVVDIVDEIVIVDTGSTDRTLEIAKQYGAKIFHYNWTGDFSEARNFALQNVTNDWVLQLDADETLDSESKPFVRQWIQRDDLTGALIKIVNFVTLADGQKEILEHYSTRLFPRHPDIFYKQPIHEQISHRLDGVDGSSVTLPLDRLISPIIIYHFGYAKKLVAERKKGERNKGILESFLKKETRNAFQHFNLGLAFAEDNDYQQALEEFQTAERLEHTGVSYYPMILVYISQMLVKLKMLEEAKKYVLRAVEMAPKLSDAMFQLAEVCRSAENEEEAVSAYEKAVEIGKGLSEEDFLILSDPGTRTWKPYNQLGVLFSLKNDCLKSVEYFVEALKMRPDAIPVLLNLGRTYNASKEIQLAEECFNKAFKLSWESAYQDLFSFYLQHKKWDLLKNFLKETQNKLPKTKWLYLKSQAAICCQDWDTALEILDVLKDEAPSPDVLHNLGCLYFAKGDYQKAALSFKGALEFDRHKYNTRIGLAKALCGLQSLEEAAGELEKIPWDVPQSLEAHLLQAQLLVALNKIAESTAVLLKLNNKHTGNCDILLRLGYNLIQMKANTNAYEILSQIIPYQPQNQELHLKLALLSTKLGHHEKAKELLDKAKALNPASNMISAIEEAINILEKLSLC